ncbi:MAG: glycosyltransferase family 39 protein [Flavobacterium sp.]|nr:glycosyltransferase family 39 protein [Flavobacterium sp.]
MKWSQNFIDNIFNSKWSFYIILIINAIIVISNLGRESLGLDEIFSATACFKSTSIEMMFSKYISVDGNPPLHYVLLYYWGRVFGSGDFQIRMLSYIISLIGFVFSYFLLKKYFTRRIAIIFLFLSAFTPGVMYYAQEARMYALLYTLSCLASILYLIFIDRIVNNQKIEKKLFIYYSFIGVFICYTHHFGSLLIFSIALVSIIYSFMLKRYKTAEILFINSLLIGLIGIVWILFQFYFVNMGNHIQEISWNRTNLIGLLLNFSTLLAVNKYGVVLLFILLIPFFTNFSSSLNLIIKNIIILIPVFLLLFCAYCIGLKIFEIGERYLIVIIPLLLLFISKLFDVLYQNNKRNILIYLLGLLIISTYKNFTYKKQNWRDASNYIKNIPNIKNSKVPIQSFSDGSFDKQLFVSYYLGNKYNYIHSGPLIQKNCDLIYINGHTNEINIKNALAKYKIPMPYKILNFNKVFVVIKDN